MNNATKAWIAVGGLVVLGLTILVIQELPAVYRELHLMRM